MSAAPPPPSRSAGDAAPGTTATGGARARLATFTRRQWVGSGIVVGVGLVVLAGLAVLGMRWLLATEPLEAFLETYPGEYELPAATPVGFPAWLAWQHFANAFLIVLVIRSGLDVRREQRPRAFWKPRRGGGRRISLTLWLHQALDVLWLANGVAYVVLLIATGQWMRIVPTSWEVLPNALSAGMQYLSLDWPTENGWVGYNALQQLSYFVTVFIAAPLATLTGIRLSGFWPKDAPRLDRLVPFEWARRVHLPTMVYFVAFIVVHVLLVLATGALRNLNHIYAAQGSVDPDAFADNWLGFWLFVASLVVTAAAWFAVKPLRLAPIARWFGTVTVR